MYRDSDTEPGLRLMYSGTTSGFSSSSSCSLESRFAASWFPPNALSKVSSCFSLGTLIIFPEVHVFQNSTSLMYDSPGPDIHAAMISVHSNRSSHDVRHRVEESAHSHELTRALVLFLLVHGLQRVREHRQLPLRHVSKTVRVVEPVHGVLGDGHGVPPSSRIW